MRINIAHARDTDVSFHNRKYVVANSVPHVFDVLENCSIVITVIRSAQAGMHLQRGR
jgi:hypothetical protein